MTRAMLRSCVAICAVVMSMECYGQKVDSLAARGDTIYWTKAGALYSWRVGAQNNTPLQPSGWSVKSKIAINGGQIVYTEAGNLVRKQLSNLNAFPTLINANGWDADSFCLANGHVYWSYQGNLFQWDMNPAHNNSQIAKTLVANDSRVVVDGQHVYWVKGDDLMKAPLTNIDGGAQIANSGGWKDTVKLAASNGVLYFTKGGNLYKNTLSNPNGAPPLNTGGWD